MKPQAALLPLTFTALALPGAAAPAPVDYIAYEPGASRVWVPVGNTGSVDVFDVARAAFTVVPGFKTAEAERDGKKRTLGPSSVTLGEGFAYVGDRADHSVCAVDARALTLGACLRLASMPDGVAYVKPAREVWVTAPGDKAVVVLDASKPAALTPKTTIHLDGEPEGYAVDEGRGLFYTNLEDGNVTLAIDVAAHTPKKRWKLDCDSKGPRGVAVDAARGFVFVACTDHLTVLDGNRDGARVADYDTGAGVDNIAWLPSRRALYVAAGKDARLTVLQVDEAGHPAPLASGASAPGVRTVVADAAGNAYGADGANARLLVFALSAR